MTKLPDYGYGAGPVYLTGQPVWYSGLEAVVVVGPEHPGDVSITVERGPTGGTGSGALDAPPLSPIPGSGWRVTEGKLTVEGPGCWQVHARGAGLDETIVFGVESGAPPPG